LNTSFFVASKVLNHHERRSLPYLQIAALFWTFFVVNIASSLTIDTVYVKSPLSRLGGLEAVIAIGRNSDSK
jgi:hypothetical protein